MIESSSEFDELVGLCEDANRRIILALLADQQHAFTIYDLTKAIVEHQHDMPLTEVSDETLQRIRDPLHHNHIPRLEGAGLVEYDSDRHLVRPTDKLEKIAPHISPILEADPGLPRPMKL